MMQKVQIGLIIAVPITAIPSSLIAVLNNKNIKMLVKVYIMVLESIHVELRAITLVENQS
ncbi:conserved hypothetical protein [Bacillus pseudomycoides]|uniref:hypothetical protein n=2 Tax=Bacillus TaxID=1386 RepID=UPI00073E6E97|nr:hypothetical protein [Bacillus mycoides]KUH41999.1 hypothetical protein M2E15_2091 [Bacillus mycoides]PQZ48553.1 hypothetical protein CQZ94_27780 [Bacillus sp. MYb209]